MQREISLLKEENNQLKSRLESTTLFLNQVLGDQTSHPVSNMSHTPCENDQPWRTATRNRPNNKRNNKRDKNKKTSNTNKQSEAKNDETAQDSEERPLNGKVLVLGDSHVKRLDEKKMKNITPCRYGGLKSDQVLLRHKGIIDEKIDVVKEVIIHVGRNDIPTRSAKEITNNIDDTVQKLKEMNNDVRVSVSAILLRVDQTNLNKKIVETNDALKKYCACHGLDFLGHGNIAFKHL